MRCGGWQDINNIPEHDSFFIHRFMQFSEQIPHTWLVDVFSLRNFFLTHLACGNFFSNWGSFLHSNISSKKNTARWEWKKFRPENTSTSHLCGIHSCGILTKKTTWALSLNNHENVLGNFHLKKLEPKLFAKSHKSFTILHEVLEICSSFTGMHA